MRKGPIYRKIAVLSCICFLLTALCGCEEPRVSLSKNMLVANETGVTVISITMDVEDNSLDNPIELLDSPLEPNKARAIIFSVPKKQAENGNWFVLAITEEGEDASSALEVGEFNPHGDSAGISCFGVYWNDDREHYSVRVYFNGSEADYGIYAPGGDTDDPDDGDSDDGDSDDDDSNTDDSDDHDSDAVGSNGHDSDEKSGGPVTVIIDGIDVSSELEIRRSGGVHFAEGKSFIESFADEEMRSRESRYLNYEYYPENGEIYVSSWFTDGAICSLFIGSTEVHRYTEEGTLVLQISEAPRIIDGEVYIPMEAFAQLIEYEIGIQ